MAVRSVTGWIRALKRMANSVKDELEQELKIEQLHADLKKAESKGLANLSPELKESIDQLKQAAESVNRPYKVEDDSPKTPTTETASTSSTTVEQPAEKTTENSSPPKSNG
ncbi:hypothetical protein O1D97_02600 [Marinomonas sp. 15G1-11]|uniref:Sec-independent protein translocase protein TatB n=1 Tax=Marinomonas phaeophyticola TaxID=3004091 RepID=A0ABT4JQA2_9GAMM|nr:hypothetical protein [Marinomonas sp. 15G1-11]